jgi:hypothetical protein
MELLSELVDEASSSDDIDYVLERYAVYIIAEFKSQLRSKYGS